MESQGSDNKDKSLSHIEIFGCMKGTLLYVGDLIAPIQEEWDAEKAAPRDFPFNHFSLE